MIDIIRANDTEEGIEAMLSQVQALKTGERSEEQRRIAILVAKIEESLAWAKYAFEAQNQPQT